MRTLLPLLVIVALVSGCTTQQYYDNAIPTTTISGGEAASQAKGGGTTTTLLPLSGPEAITGFSGPKYLRFSKTAYEQSLSEGKVIHLYFYANWCPICAEERPKIFAAYNKLNYTDVVGYEVHYNDNEVTNDDLYAARLFQIPYQHTTVILNKKGAVSFKSFAAIGTERLISEIERARGV
ncbi:MAG: thioredoxin family protein [Candidatus Aenigmarchaeota archaeon]|nr:thioredoxin family protein [Candidatus Aenigmarchaeota archaeon]